MAPVQIKPLYDSAGARVLLTKRIGGGGEGDVYGVHSPLHHDVVAKIYHKSLSAEKQEKLLQGKFEQLQNQIKAAIEGKGAPQAA